MSSIDERVVQMKFNNSQFSQGVKQTTSDLDALKKGLNLDASTKSLDGLDAAGKRFSLEGMASGIEQLSSKFSALGVMGVTALANITNKAVDAGLRIAKSLTVAPIADGMNDYLSKLTSVQTIMNATGSSIDVVSGYFGELDTYADKTIYNLTDMTGAFAKFTNAGVDMDKSVPAIKGIANMVALAGQDAGAASIAMYNLSQSIAGGFLTTTDYKSLNLANVATKEWKTQMIEGALAAGTLKEGTDGLYEIPGAKGAHTDQALFNEQLAEGWATTEVLMGVLGDYGDTTTEIGKKAQAAAQDVKSYGMMMETLTAGVGTGWTDTFEIVIGNIEEAKALWTPLTNTLGGFLDSMADARNDPLKEWKSLGGRTAAIDAIKFAFEGLMSIARPIKEAFQEIFPATTGDQLYKITTAIRDFAEGLKLSAGDAANLKSTFKGLFAVVDIGWMIIKQVVGVIFDLIGAISGGGGSVLAFTGTIGDFLVKVRDAIKNGEGLTKFFDGLSAVLQFPIKMLLKFKDLLVDVFSGMDFSGLGDSLSGVTDRFAPLQSIGHFINDAWDNIPDLFNKVLNAFDPLKDKLVDFFSGFGVKITDAMGNIDYNLILDGINTGLFAGLVLLIRKFFKGGFKDAVEDGDESIIDKIKGMFGGVTDTLSAMQSQLKAGTLITIAGAVGILAGSILILSTIDSAKLAVALGGIGAMMGMLVATMAVLDHVSTSTGFIKLPFITAALIPLSIALLILASAVKKMSDLDWNELAKGLTGVAVLLGLLVGAAKLLDDNKSGLISGGIGMIAIAIAIKILVDAVEDFSDMDWEELGRGLAGLGATLAALAIFTQIAKTGKGALSSAVGFIILAAALKIMASALEDFSDFDWDKMGRGFAGLGGALAAVAIGMRLMPKNMLAQAAALAIIGGSLKIMADVLGDFSDMEWDDIGRGLAGMGGALGIVAIGMHAMPKNMLITATALVVVAGALKIVHSVLEDMGDMSWEEIGKGFVVLAGSLLILAGGLYLMTAAIPGALALIIAAGALSILTPVLIALGDMSWEEIGKGLVMLAGTLLLLAIGGVALILALPGLIGLGVAAALIGAGALMAGIGLTAMALALAALAISLPLVTEGILGLVKGILELIPFAMEQLALGIAAFVQTIADNGPVFLNAMITLILMLLQGINTVAPEIIQTMINLIWMLLTKIDENLPNFVNKGAEILINLLNGISDKLPEITAAGARLVVTFINGVAEHLPEIINAGMNLIIQFVSGLAQSIRNNQSAMNSAGAELGWAVADGMTGGLASKIPALAQKAAEMAGAALQAAKDFLNINSPSRKFIEIGKSTGEGFVVGIERSTSWVEKASESMASASLASVAQAMTSISDYADMDLDMVPTITPILDLSEVKKEAAGLNGMLPEQKLDLSANVNKANWLNDAQTKMLNTTDDPATMVNNERPVEIKYVQNNYSPKALSAVEIYRQTNNQIATAKGLVTI